MASIACSCRLSAWAASQIVRNNGTRRSFRTASRALAAQNFLMPALSPTMTEGNIATWKLKEGDSFSAGDVILEVETDKATMDVEAQDDGVLAKIMQPDGSKSVKVGSRIAVLAEQEDDLSTLSIPAEDTTASPASPEPAAEQPQEARPKETQSSSGPPPSDIPTKPQKHTYPLYPSVSVLLHTHNLSASDVPATGPNGRLLKGDVLAYLKTIPASYPSELSARLGKLSHLDLSNIQPAPSQPAKSTPSELQKQPAPPSSPEPQAPPRVLATPVSLAPALALQQRLSDALGVSPPPLATLIARAVELANEDLPPTTAPPTAGELFDSIVGAATAGRRPSRGHFMPSIGSAAPMPPQTLPKAMSRHGGDLFDQIVAPRRAAARPVSVSASASDTVARSGVAGAENVFSLVVPDAREERRAKVFLERFKTVLESSPGRLVL